MTVNLVKLSLILAVFNLSSETFTFPLENNFAPAYTINNQYDPYYSGYEIMKLDDKRLKYKFTTNHFNEPMLEETLLNFVPLSEKFDYDLQKDINKDEIPIGKSLSNY